MRSPGQTVALASMPASQPEPASAGRRRRQLLGLAAVTALAVGHAALVGLRYHVGSFDDDGHYLALARALAHGLGFVDTSQSGNPLEATVPPGYPALLAPIALAFPRSLAAPRALSAACWLAVFPLCWYWLGLRRVAPRWRLAALLLLALSPLGATYATMVMAEAPFLVVLLLLLIAMHHWERQHAVSTGWGWAALTALVALVYLKTAGAAFVPAVGLYLLLRHRWRQAVFVVGGAVLALAPLPLGRLLAGTPVVGQRYAGDLALPDHSVLAALGRAASGLGEYVVSALPNTVLPTYVSTLQGHGPLVTGLLAMVHYTVAPLVVAGFVRWQLRRRDVTIALAPLYLLETLLYPYINERRVVLLLPLVLVWYVGGLRAFGGLLTAALGRLGASAGRTRPVLAGVAVVLVVPTLAAQFPRDYLYRAGVGSSRPAGSAYLAVLRQAAEPGAVIAASYRWTVSAFTGHPTTRSLATLPCGASSPAAYEQAVRAQAASEHVAFVLVARLNPHPDSGCLGQLLASSPRYAVRLYHQPRDAASVYELIGPGTPHPGLADLTVGQAESVSPDGVTVSFARPALVRQISVGAAGAADLQTDRATVRRVEVQLRLPRRQWVTVLAAPGPVGPRVPGGPAYLLRRLDTPRTATAVRVIIEGRGPARVDDLHVLGELRGGR